MGVFKCDTDALTIKVQSDLKNGKTSLDDGANILASISIPSSFSLSESLASAPSKIRNNGEKISSLQKWVTDVVEKFTGAEKANNAAINSLTSNISKMDLSVGIGAGLTIDSNNNFLVTLEEKFKNIIDEFLDNNKKEESTNADIVEDYETPFSLIDTIKNEIDSISETIDEIPILSNVIDLTKTVVCSTFISVTSAWKGILELLGSLIDTITLLGAVIISIPALIADCIYYLASDSSPTLDRFVDYMDNYSATTAMWKAVMGFVATTYVENAWNDFYEKSFIGQKLDENAVEIFKHDGLGCDILSGIGYISGIVIITILTMGIAGVGAGASAGAGTAVSATVSTSTSTILSSVIAASSAFGKYTGESWAEDREASWEGIEEAFKRGDISKADYESMKKIRDLTDEEWNAINDEYLAGNITLEQMQLMEQIREMPADWRTGENLESGLAYGGLNAIWEGAQWLVGGFLGKITAGIGKVGAAIRVSVDSIFNTMDTPFRSLITASTEGRDFGEVFEEKGGWLSVLSDFSIGLIGSVGGEIFDSIKTSKLDELHQQLKSFMQQSDTNKQNLIEGITDNIPKELSIEEKARAAYIKLNQTLSYSDEYFALNRENGKTGDYSQRLAEIYYKQFDIKNMDTDSVICNNWSQIYKDLLIELGINPKKISIKGPNVLGTHKWVIADIGGGNLILADATNTIIDMPDITGNKLDLMTHGFIVTTEKEYKKAYNEASKRQGNIWVNLFKILNEDKNNINKVENIDKQIGYEISDFIKDLEDVIGYYSGSQTNVQMNNNEKIDIIKSIINEDMGAIDAYMIMRNYAKQLFGENTQVKFYTKGDKVITVATLFDANGNQTYLYKINRGALQITDNIQPILEGVTK